MEINGFFLIHRRIFEDPLWLKGTPVQKALMILCIGKANHEPKQWLWQGEKFEVQRGQFITSLDSLKKKLGKGITMQKLRTALNNLEKYQFLTNKSTKTGRLITIVNYCKYQDIKIKSNKGNNKDLTKKQQRGNKEVTPNNNDNNDNNENNTRDTTARSDKSLQAKAIINFTFETNKWENITSEDIDIWKEAYPACDINLGLKQMRSWLIANPKKKKKNYRRFITNWLSRWQEKGGSTKSEKYEEDASEKYRTV